jgi:hypothetical protein
MPGATGRWLVCEAGTVLADEELRSGPLDPRLSLAVDLHHTAIVERDDVQAEEPDPLTRRAVDGLRRRLLFEEVQRAP